MDDEVPALAEATELEPVAVLEEPPDELAPPLVVVLAEEDAREVPEELLPELARLPEVVALGPVLPEECAPLPETKEREVVATGEP